LTFAKHQNQSPILPNQCVKKPPMDGESLNHRDA
jgi:hypothetical protein